MALFNFGKKKEEARAPAAIAAMRSLKPQKKLSKVLTCCLK